MKDLDIKKIQPTKGYVLVEPAKSEEKTKSGIILSESDSEKPQYGVVLAVGEADCECNDRCEDDDCCGEGCCSSEEKASDSCCGGGCCDCDEDEEEQKGSCCASACSCSSSSVQVGDKVIYKKWGGNEFKIGDVEYQFLKFEDILAIIK